MILLFSEQGMQRLDEIVRPGVLCAFDFDGTLSPIVRQPHKAALPADVLEKLLELSKYAPIGIITGRSLADIQTRLGFKPGYVVGNHGLEGVPGWEWRGRQYEEICRNWEQALAARLEDRERFEEGVWIENKQYSLSVHYRMTEDRGRTEAALGELFLTLAPEARVIAGKCVFSLLPQDAADKGSALEQLMWISGASNAIYVGDDVTDEDVFRLRRPDLLSVRVEPNTESAADFYIAQRRDIVQLLDELIVRLRNLHPAPRDLPAAAEKT